MGFRIHGGSFIVGSATSPVFDGSNLALATNSIVAVIQHRLGAVSLFLVDLMGLFMRSIARFHGP